MKNSYFVLIIAENPYSNPPPYEKLVGDLSGAYSRQNLIASFGSLPSWLKDDPNNSINDWYQSNWEILVENPLMNRGIVKSVIDVYGDGADCNGSSSRVSLHELQPKQSIHVNDGYIFHSYGTMKNEWYYQEPPFDIIRAEKPNDEILLVAASEAELTIDPSYDCISIQVREVDSSSATLQNYNLRKALCSFKLSWHTIYSMIPFIVCGKYTSILKQQSRFRKYLLKFYAVTKSGKISLESQGLKVLD